MSSAVEAARAHYRSPDLAPQIERALGERFSAERALTVVDLASFDQFHVGGLEATATLAERCQPTVATRVLDLGSGLGGPARYLAERYGCRVEGVDLSGDFVAAANALSARLGLSELVHCRVGDVLDLPYDAESFDLVWTQHVAMNVADRERLYSEAARVLRPGGLLAIHDPLATDVTPVIYPTPWARAAEHSHLLTATQLRSHLRRAGRYSISAWHDVTSEGLARLPAPGAAPAAPSTAADTPLTLARFLGPEVREWVQNFARNLREGRLALVQVVARRLPT